MAPDINRFIVKLKNTEDIIRPGLANNTKALLNMWFMKNFGYVFLACGRN
jgi:hypothetical protein